jgi:hypothetical protein
MLAAPVVFAGPIRVGSITDARFGWQWTLNGPQMANTRAKLLNPSNFGPSGVIRRAIQITDTAAAKGSVNVALLEQFDVFFVGYFGDSEPNAFTAAEIDAFRAWAWNGGSLIVTCDDESVDAVCAAFGHPSGGPLQGPVVPAAGAGAHPLVKGQFGESASLAFSGDYSSFQATTGADVVLRESGAGQRAVVIVRRWGAGQVILFSDIDIIANAASAGDSIATDNDRFLGHLFAFAAMPYDLIIDAAAHTGGASGSVWRSDVDLLNVARTGDTAVTVSLLRANQGNLSPATAAAAVPAGRSLRLEDVLAGLFNAGNAGLGLHFAGGELLANSRFYNVGAADGNVYGMYIPSTNDRETVRYGRPGVFHHLSYTPGSASGSRVNIGGVSRVPFPVHVVISLYDDAGDFIEFLTHTFQPYEHRQFTKIHEIIGSPAVTHGYATVELTTWGGAVDMYAMLIENKSGDPIYMPPAFAPAVPAVPLVAAPADGNDKEPTPGASANAATATCSGPYQRIIAAAANTGGANGTKWLTDLDLLNRGAAPATVDLARLKANQANTSPLVESVVVPAGETLRLSNILGTLLPAANAGLGIRVCGGEAYANSRFYNVGSAAGKVYGMYVPAMAPADAVTPCHPGVFHHLSYSPNAAAGQRINIGATNATAIATEWVITLFGDDGSVIGTQTATLAAYEHRQYTNIHKLLGTPAVASGWASVEVTTPGGAIHPYAMRIENVGGDPVYMPAELLDVATSTRVADAFAGAWMGSWTNTTFASSGSALLRLSFDLPNQAVQATIDLGGNVFGGVDPPPQTLTGALTDSGIVFAGTSPAFGTYAVTIDGFCSLSGRLTALPNPAIASVDLSGKVTPSGIQVAYTVQFSALGGGGTANGTFTLAR